MIERKGRIGFISTRLAGTDGVSLETVKWSNVLTNLGHECYYFAGESDWPEERSCLVPEAHFNHPLIASLNAELFSDYVRSPKISHKIQEAKDFLKKRLYDFNSTFQLDLLIAENILSLPMNVPLGLALTEFIAENYFPTLAHHHDFFWERERYALTAADDYLRMAFPPTLRSITHVVINSFAGRQLALRAGSVSTLIPNVMDFHQPPSETDDYVSDFRAILGIKPDEYILLQPTRVVPRKRIEHAIELARRIGVKCALVISHSSGDEGGEYQTHLQDYADLMGVRIIFASDIINHYRSQKPGNKKIFSIADVYRQADLVTYPSSVEGFGNAFLETIYYKKPIVMSAYEIFKTDIQPKGFKVIGFENFVREDTVRQVRTILNEPGTVAEMTKHNYELGRLYYSNQVLETRLASLVSERIRVQKEAKGYRGYKKR
jgi:glycosyltransferase involved in cell wall biosynthesis